MLHINGFHTQQHLGALVGGHHPDAVVELGARHRAADRRERRARPLDFDVAAEPDHPQPAVLHAALEPRAEPQPLQLRDRARGQAVAAGLVAGELRGVDDQHVAPGATAHAAAAEPAGPAPTTTTSARVSMPPSMLAG